MATVDELIIAIKADTKDLNKKLSKTNKQLKKSGQEAEKAGKRMKSAFSKGKVGVVLMGAAIIKTVTAIAKVGMQFEDLKDSLDTVFGSMDAGDVAMQKVMKFAQTTPFQIEDATKAFIALKSAGIEPSMDMLQTFADTASVSVDSLGTFEALIRMVQRSASGGMGLEELNMISDKGIDVLGILGEKLQLGKDDIAKFGKTADGAAKMVKALTEGLKEKFGGAMENKMDNLSVKASNMTIAFKGLADDVFNSGLGDFLKNMADSLTELADGILRARMAARGEIFPNMEAILALEIPEQRLNALAAPIRKVKKEIEDTVASITHFEAKGEAALVRPHEAKLTRLENMLDLMEKMEKQLIKEISIPKKADPVSLTKEQIQLQQEFNKLFDDTISDYDKLQIKIDTLNESLAKGTLDAKNNPLFDPEKGAVVLKHLQDLQDALGDVEGFSETMEAAVISTSQAFSKEFVDALLDGEDALESFKNFAKNMVSQIIAIFLQMAVINKILNAVFNAGLPEMNIGGMGDGGASVTGIQTGADYSGHVAGGGKVQGGSAYMVGERGAEIFVPDSSGTIMNNMNSRNMGGGTTVVVNQSVNFATGVVPTVRAEVQKMMPQISDVTKGAVLEAAVRGGSFKKGLMGSG